MFYRKNTNIVFYKKRIFLRAENILNNLKPHFTGMND
jgi:hypothetical protein